MATYWEKNLNKLSVIRKLLFFSDLNIKKFEIQYFLRNQLSIENNYFVKFHKLQKKFHYKIFDTETLKIER